MVIIFALGTTPKVNERTEMPERVHDPLQHLRHFREILSADKLSIGFFLGAGCPCSIRIPNPNGGKCLPLIPNISELTAQVSEAIRACNLSKESFETLIETFVEDSILEPTIEVILNRIRAFRDVAGKSNVRGLSEGALENLDRKICATIRNIVTRNLPNEFTPYNALARFIRMRRSLFTEIFTTNYDLLVEEALENQHVPYFDGFVGSARPFFDQRAIEDDTIPPRWSRLWKLHGSINWRINKSTKAVFRSEIHSPDDEDLLIHPSHLKYDESRRMPYFVMIDRLRSFIRHPERPVALFISGYSFGDEHINANIIESLKANASSACFALQFGELANYPEAIKLAERNFNLSVFADDGAVIRGHTGQWMASPTADVTAPMGAVEICSMMATTDAKAPVSDAEVAEEPRPFRMTLGDFKQLGNFLDQISDSVSPALSAPEVQK